MFLDDAPLPRAGAEKRKLAQKEPRQAVEEKQNWTHEKVNKRSTMNSGPVASAFFFQLCRLHFPSTELTLGRQDAGTIKDRQLTDSVARSSTSHPRIPATRAETSGRPTREQGIKEKATHSNVTKCVILEAQCAVSRFPGDHPVHHILQSSVSLHGGLTPLHLTAATRARRASTEGP